jgi:hypothetical protein
LVTSSRRKLAQIGRARKLIAFGQRSIAWDTPATVVGELLRRHVVGLLALFVALGGTAVAVTSDPAENGPTPSAETAKKKKAKKGRRGPQGPPGPQGAQGVPGQPGQDGAAGAPGSNGSTGSAGPGLFSGSAPTFIQNDVAGAPFENALVPFSGTLDGTVQIFEGSFDFGDEPGVGAVSENLTITALVGSSTLKAGASPANPITVTAQVHTAPLTSNVMSPAGPPCAATPSLAGPLPIGTVISFNCSGLSIPITPGKAVIVVKASAPPGPPSPLDLQTTIGSSAS